MTRGVEAERILGLVRESGLRTREQAGFIKVAGAARGAIYVARTRRISRIDVSGFEVPPREGGPPWAVVDLGGESFGAVRQRVDFSRTDEEVIETVSHILSLLRDMPAPDPAEARRQRRRPGSGPAPRRETGRPPVPSPPVPGDSVAPPGPGRSEEEVRAERLMLIKRVAAEMKRPVHPETLRDLGGEAAPAPDPSLDGESETGGRDG